MTYRLWEETPRESTCGRGKTWEVLSHCVRQMHGYHGQDMETGTERLSFL